MNPNFEHLRQITRRSFLARAGQFSLGAIALATLGGKSRAGDLAALNPLAPRRPQFAPKAKRVIFLHMSGGPPHLDMFDYKPELVKHNDENCPDSMLKGNTFAFTSGVPKLLGTTHTFKQHGRSCAWMSEVVPQLASIADDLTFIKSMHSEQFNHAPAELLLYT